jgi:hypothetical protein
MASRCTPHAASELRIFFQVTRFDESKKQHHWHCSKYFTIILLSENFLKAISIDIAVTKRFSLAIIFKFASYMGLW